MLFLGCFQLSWSQPSSGLLNKADSLFAQRKYTESYELYQQLFEEEKLYTSQMLLKMAYIKEGLGQYEMALFYLQTYYLKTYDDLVLDKMNKISEQQNLSGYEQDDLSYLLTQLRKYYVELVYGLMMAISLFMFIMVWKRFKSHSRPLYSAIFTSLLVLILGIIVNYGQPFQEGIVAQNKVYLMEGPSAGSDLVTIIDKGHKVDILDEENIWTLIRHNDQLAYVRSNSLLRIR